MEKILLNVEETKEYLGLGDTMTRKLMRTESFGCRIGNRLYSDIQTGLVYVQQLTTDQRTFDVTFSQPFDSVPTVIAMSTGGYPQAEGGMSVRSTNRNGFKLIVENTENNTTYGYIVKYIAIAR